MVLRGNRSLSRKRKETRPLRVEIRDLQSADVDHSLLRRVARATGGTQDRQIDEINVVLVDNDRMLELNRQLLNRDRPTDVIAFEAETEPDGRWRSEVYISVEQAEIQAQERGHSIESELAFLLAHAVLHAFGLTDATDEQRQEMLKIQQAVIKQFEELNGIG